MTVRVLVVDNHDSFVHTLVGYLRELDASVDLVESDAIDESGLIARIEHHDAVLLSPGPGTPADAGISPAAVQVAAERRVPLLGVCLGHQTIGAAFGMRVGEAPELMHGMVSEITHDSTGLFAGLPSPLAVGRYHSLALAEDELPEGFRVTARTSTGTVMAIEHRDLPILGVQFHPESVLTEGGYRLLANWLELCGDAHAVERAAPLTPRAPHAL
ncbi:MAG: anthranilate synthase component II [Actinomycetota bacterium]